MATLTPAQRLAYDRDGLVSLPSAVAPADVRRMADALWDAMDRMHGIKPNRPETWTVRNPTGFAAVSRTGVFAAMASPIIEGALADLLGPDWARPARWGVPLVTLPDPESAWDVPHHTWHLDVPATAETPAIGRVFVLLAPLAAGGGGTVVATGSHLLFQALARKAGKPIRSADAIRQLKVDYPWFSELTAPRGENRIERFMRQTTTIDGASVRIVEMTGQPGDAFLMHPSILHAPAPNTLSQPRLMLTQFIEGHAGAMQDLSRRA